MSLLAVSQQRWKLFLFLAVMALGAAVTLLQGFLYAPLGKAPVQQLVLGALAAIVGTLLWACLDLVCPRCRLKLLWHAVAKVGFASWFAWLLTTETCPGCGYSGRPESPAGKGRRRGRR